MRINGYGRYLSEAYDSLNTDVDYKQWADFYEDCFRKYSQKPVRRVCEMACGTGSMALELGGRRYHVTAFDLSETMLTLADKKASDAGITDIRFTCQDMRDFKVYAPVQAVICMMDGLNCLTSKDDVVSALDSVSTALEDGGIFVFDVNTKYKFENIYADNAYVLEADGVFLAWQNFYNSKTRKCDMFLTFFFENQDGRYVRCDEKIVQKMYSLKILEKMLLSAGFDVLDIIGGFDFSKADENKDERAYFVCRKNAVKQDLQGRS